jgi:hypothetical protein
VSLEVVEGVWNSRGVDECTRVFRGIPSLEMSEIE